MTRYLIEDEPCGLAEHLAFEAGAENMELRAMRLEALREAELEALCGDEAEDEPGEAYYEALCGDEAEEAEDAYYEALGADSFEF
jgi:hypothetical protein